MDDTIDRQLLRTIRAEIVAASTAAGLNVRLALSVSDRVESRLLGRSASQPRWSSKAERNALIRAAFNGTNHAAVCEDFGICRATLYNVLRNTSPAGPGIPDMG